MASMDDTPRWREEIGTSERTPAATREEIETMQGAIEYWVQSRSGHSRTLHLPENPETDGQQPYCGRVGGGKDRHIKELGYAQAGFLRKPISVYPIEWLLDETGKTSVCRYCLSAWREGKTPYGNPP